VAKVGNPCAKRIGIEQILLKQDEELGRFTSSLYICQAKITTALDEYGTRC